jgi:hypothetical protein
MVFPKIKISKGSNDMKKNCLLVFIIILFNIFLINIEAFSNPIPVFIETRAKTGNITPKLKNNMIVENEAINIHFKGISDRANFAIPIAPIVKTEAIYTIYNPNNKKESLDLMFPIFYYNHNMEVYKDLYFFNNKKIKYEKVILPNNDKRVSQIKNIWTDSNTFYDSISKEKISVESLKKAIHNGQIFPQEPGNNKNECIRNDNILLANFKINLPPKSRSKLKVSYTVPVLYITLIGKTYTDYYRNAHWPHDWGIFFQYHYILSSIKYWKGFQNIDINVIMPSNLELYSTIPLLIKNSKDGNNTYIAHIKRKDKIQNLHIAFHYKPDSQLKK